MKGHNYGERCRKCGKFHKHPKGMLGRENKWGHHTEETKDKQRQTMTGDKNPRGMLNKHQTKYQKDNQRKIMIGKKQSEETKEKNRQTHLGLHQTEETKEKQRKATTKTWKKPEFRKKWVESIHKKPSGLETRGYDFLHKYTFPYIYCGDGSFKIGKINPDFREKNGKKKCIEISDMRFRKPFHNETKEEYEQQRINHFKKYGWKCLVLWEDELRDEEQLVEKIRNFTNI